MQVYTRYSRATRASLSNHGSSVQIRDGKFAWLQPSLWPDTTEQCLDNKCVGKMVDGVMKREIRSKTR